MNEEKIIGENMESDNERKSKVDAKLYEMGLVPIIEETKPVVKILQEEITPKKLVEILRESRKEGMYMLKSSKEGANYHEVRDYRPDYRLIESEVESIRKLNRSIEEKVKIDILGLNSSPLNRIYYKIKDFYREKVLGENRMAEDLIHEQGQKVEVLIKHVTLCSDVITARVENLERYCNSGYNDLIAHSNQLKKLKKEAREKLELLANTRDVVRQEKEDTQKLNYLKALGKLRGEVQKANYEMDRIENAQNMLHNEIPIIDGLLYAGRAYVNSIDTTKQEAIMMSKHIANVMSIYLDIIKTQYVNESILSAVNKLSSYTTNMSNALRKGISKMSKPETIPFLERETNDIEFILDNIEGKENYFKKIENRLRDYLPGGEK